MGSATRRSAIPVVVLGAATSAYIGSYLPSRDVPAPVARAGAASTELRRTARPMRRGHVLPGMAGRVGGTLRAVTAGPPTRPFRVAEGRAAAHRPVPRRRVAAS